MSGGWIGAFASCTTQFLRFVFTLPSVGSSKSICQLHYSIFAFRFHLVKRWLFKEHLPVALLNLCVSFSPCQALAFHAENVVNMVEFHPLTCFAIGVCGLMLRDTDSPNMFCHWGLWISASRLPFPKHALPSVSVGNRMIRPGVAEFPAACLRLDVHVKVDRPWAANKARNWAQIKPQIHKTTF